MFENAGDKIPNHLLRVDDVSHTLIHLFFVNVRVNYSRVCIELKRGDTLDLGDDNKFLVILLDPTDEYEYDEDADEADDVDEGREEADVKKPPSYPKRRDGEDDKEPYPPTTTKADVDAGKDGDANHNDPSSHTLPRPMPKPQ
jgi:hypothetical protein